MLDNTLLLLGDETAAVKPSNPNTIHTAFCIPTTPRRVWWPAAVGEEDAELDRYIAETRARGYDTAQVLVSGRPYAVDYPYISPDVSALDRTLSRCKLAGLTTMVAFDDARGSDLSYLRAILTPLRSLIDWCFGVYECNGVFRNPEIVLDVLKQSRDLLPDARLGVHFTPVNEGYESFGHVDWHRAQSEAGLNCFFLQLAAWEQSINENIARVQDFTRRLMAGMNGYPILSHGVNVYELTTSRTYRYEWTEQQAVAVTDAIMNAPLAFDGSWQAVKPNGFGDSGTI